MSLIFQGFIVILKKGTGKPLRLKKKDSRERNATIINKEFLSQEAAITDSVSLPADSIETFEECVYCVKCQHKGVPTGKLIVCSQCESKSLLDKCIKRFNVRLCFNSTTDGRLSLILPSTLLEKFAALVNIELSEGENIQVELLTNSDFDFIFNSDSHIVKDIVPKTT